MAYNGIMKAVSELVYETRHSAIDGLVDFLKVNVHLDQEFLAHVQQYKNTIKLDKHLKNNPKENTQKKKDRPKRTPSPFNLFIREAMLKLKESQPELNNTDRMRAAIALWNEDKKKKGT
jgi:hypothetical protein